MAQPKCRKRRLSLGRRMTCDYIRFSGSGPTAAAERIMQLADVAAARHQASPRPSWGAILTKAFARAARNHPALRTAYFSFPWGHLGEYEWQIGSVIVQRRVDDEDVLLLAPLVKPEEKSLTEIDRLLRRYHDEPVDAIRPFREQLRIGRLPSPFRRLLWWLCRNLLPGRRARDFGTFGVTTMSPFGAKSLHAPSLWSALLHYGAMAPSGETPVAISFDHRVMDGAVVGYALMEMEQVLNYEIVPELRSMRGVRAA